MSEDKLSEEGLREEIKNLLSWGHSHDYDDIIREARADAWERGYDQAHEDLANDGFGEFQSPNPYRVRERNNGKWCMAEHCEHRHWRSGGMPTHQRGEDCPVFKEKR